MTESGDRGQFGRRGIITVLICASAIMLTSLDGTILNVALPSIQRSFHARTSDLQWTVDAYVLLRASIIFLSGATADRFGRRRNFNVGLAMFLVGSLACALAPSVDALIAFRAFQGFGSAVLTPSSLAILTNTFTDRRLRALAVGIWGGLSSFAQSTGPVIGGGLVQAFGWRSVFFINLPFGLLAMLGARKLAESKSAVPRALDVPGQASIGLGLFALTYALIAAPDFGWHSPYIISAFVLAAAFWAGFVGIERRSKTPMLVLSYFRSRSLSGSGLLAIFAFIAVGGFLFFNTLYLQEVRGLSPLHAGLLSMPVAGAGLLLAPISGHLTGTRGARLPATIALGCIATAMLALSLVLTRTTPEWQLIGCYLCLGCGVGLVNTPITNGAISGMPRDQAGVASAVSTTGRMIGLNLGVALIGSVVFSIAGHNTLTAGAPGHPVAAHAGDLFVHGMRAGDLLCAALATLGVFVALWAYSGRTTLELSD